MLDEIGFLKRVHRKKKSKGYIIPASRFSQTASPASPASPINPETNKSPRASQSAQSSPSAVQSSQNIAQNETKPPILENRGPRKRSAFSLKNLEEAPKTDLKLEKELESTENMPADDFSNSSLLEAWDAFIAKLQNEGRRSLASVLSSTKPGIIGTNIKLVLSNKLMAEQMDKGMPELLGYLRKKLNNYKLKVSYTIEEKTEKKFVYTPEEKYAKMLELNPKLKELRRKFELDL